MRKVGALRATDSKRGVAVETKSEMRLSSYSNTIICYHYAYITHREYHIEDSKLKRNFTFV